jgi:hypothetical protein
MTFRVLITGATTPAGRSLLDAFQGSCVTLLACDCDEDATSALCQVAPQYRCLVQSSDSPEFVGELVALCVLHDVDVLVPMRDSDQVALSRVSKVFERLGIRLWLAPIPAQATHSHARRIVQLGERRRSMQAVGAWFRRVSGSELGAHPDRSA